MSGFSTSRGYFRVWDFKCVSTLAKNPSARFFPSPTVNELKVMPHGSSSGRSCSCAVSAHGTGILALSGPSIVVSGSPVKNRS